MDTNAIIAMSPLQHVYAGSNCAAFSTGGDVKWLGLDIIYWG